MPGICWSLSPMLDWSLSPAAMSSRARPLRPATLSGFTRTIAASSLTRTCRPWSQSRRLPFPVRPPCSRRVLLEIGIHQLDLIRFLTGEEVAEVRCEMDRSSAGSPESRALVSLRTTGHLPCLVDVSRVTSGRVSRAEWVGADGQMIADWVRHQVSMTSARSGLEEWPVEDQPTVVATLRAFLDALDRGAPMPITGLDGQRAVEIADACYQSADT